MLNDSVKLLSPLIDRRLLSFQETRKDENSTGRTAIFGKQEITALLVLGGSSLIYFIYSS
jgi:hypothetical protein